MSVRALHARTMNACPHRTSAPTMRLTYCAMTPCHYTPWQPAAAPQQPAQGVGAAPEDRRRPPTHPLVLLQGHRGIVPSRRFVPLGRPGAVSPSLSV